MTYQEKYLKYKKKYLELKGAGLDKLPDVLNNEIVSSDGNIFSQRNCKDVIGSLVTKQAINAVNWKSLETRIPTINTALNMNNPQSVTCGFAKPEELNDCNSYLNKCKLKHLFNKYRPGVAVPGNFDVNTLNDILFRTIPYTIIEDRSSDIASLIAFGATVIGIPDNAFRFRHLINVTIPNSVTSIGHNAFSGNQLTNVIIPNSVTSIGEDAFTDNKLTSITIGNSVENIGYGAFYKNQLIDVIIPNSVTSIGQNAFFVNQLENVIIPNSVTYIGYGAFYNNQLTNVTIPRRFEPILNQYFDNLKRITFTYT
jgi:hypothetical protein